MSMNAAVRVGDPVGHSVSQSLFGEAQAARAAYAPRRMHPAARLSQRCARRFATAASDGGHAGTSIDPATGVPMVAFKGTTSGADWMRNFYQGAGKYAAIRVIHLHLIDQVILALPLGQGGVALDLVTNGFG